MPLALSWMQPTEWMGKHKGFNRIQSFTGSAMLWPSMTTNATWSLFSLLSCSKIFSLTATNLSRFKSLISLWLEQSEEGLNQEYSDSSDDDAKESSDSGEEASESLPDHSHQPGYLLCSDVSRTTRCQL